MRKIMLSVFLAIFFVACAGRSTALPTATGTTIVGNWQDRLRQCITDQSFLAPLLPALDMYPPNAGSIEVTTALTPTSRGCITLPEDLYPTTQREFSSTGSAYMGYVSNWEPVCGGMHSAPLPGDCTGEGYEAGGPGTVTFIAKPATEGIPELTVHFEIGVQPTP